jgi:hypothetical protein
LVLFCELEAQVDLSPVHSLGSMGVVGEKWMQRKGQMAMIQSHANLRDIFAVHANLRDIFAAS